MSPKPQDNDVHTPPSTNPTMTGIDSHDGFNGLVPGKTYVILEKISSRAITLSDSGLCLEDVEEESESWEQRNRWLCVEANGYFALQDATSGKYIGHNGKQGMHAKSTKFGGWECVTTRDHPTGGYQLLSPHWLDTLMPIVVAQDGKSLERRQHGTTLWRFVKISD